MPTERTVTHKINILSLLFTFVTLPIRASVRVFLSLVKRTSAAQRGILYVLAGMSISLSICGFLLLTLLLQARSRIPPPVVGWSCDLQFDYSESVAVALSPVAAEACRVQKVLSGAYDAPGAATAAAAAAAADSLLGVQVPSFAASLLNAATAPLSLILPFSLFLSSPPPSSFDPAAVGTAGASENGGVAHDPYVAAVAATVVSEKHVKLLQLYDRQQKDVGLIGAFSAAANAAMAEEILTEKRGAGSEKLVLSDLDGRKKYKEEDEGSFSSFFIPDGKRRVPPKGSAAFGDVGSAKSRNGNRARGGIASPSSSSSGSGFRERYGFETAWVDPRGEGGDASVRNNEGRGSESTSYGSRTQTIWKKDLNGGFHRAFVLDPDADDDFDEEFVEPGSKRRGWFRRIFFWKNRNAPQRTASRSDLRGGQGRGPSGGASSRSSLLYRGVRFILSPVTGVFSRILSIALWLVRVVQTVLLLPFRPLLWILRFGKPAPTPNYTQFQVPEFLQKNEAPFSKRYSTSGGVRSHLATSVTPLEVNLVVDLSIPEGHQDLFQIRAELFHLDPTERKERMQIEEQIWIQNLRRRLREERIRGREAAESSFEEGFGSGNLNDRRGSDLDPKYERQRRTRASNYGARQSSPVFASRERSRDLDRSWDREGRQRRMEDLEVNDEMEEIPPKGSWGFWRSSSSREGARSHRTREEQVPDSGSVGDASRHLRDSGSRSNLFSERDVRETGPGSRYSRSGARYSDEEYDDDVKDERGAKRREGGDEVAEKEEDGAGRTPAAERESSKRQFPSSAEVEAVQLANPELPGPIVSVTQSSAGVDGPKETLAGVCSASGRGHDDLGQTTCPQHGEKKEADGASSPRPSLSSNASDGSKEILEGGARGAPDGTHEAKEESPKTGAPSSRDEPGLKSKAGRAVREEREVRDRGSVRSVGNRQRPSTTDDNRRRSRVTSLDEEARQQRWGSRRDYSPRRRSANDRYSSIFSDTDADDAEGAYRSNANFLDGDIEWSRGKRESRYRHLERPYGRPSRSSAQYEKLDKAYGGDTYDDYDDEYDEVYDGHGFRAYDQVMYVENDEMYDERLKSTRVRWAEDGHQNRRRSRDDDATRQNFVFRKRNLDAEKTTSSARQSSDRRSDASPPSSSSSSSFTASQINGGSRFVDTGLLPATFFDESRYVLSQHEVALLAKGSQTHINFGMPLPYRWLRSAVLLPLRIMGLATDGTTTVRLPMIVRFMDSANGMPPATHVRVRLSSRSAATGQLPPPPVHWARIQIQPRTTFKQRMLSRLRPSLLTTFVAGFLILVASLGSATVALFFLASALFLGHLARRHRRPTKLQTVNSDDAHRNRLFASASATRSSTSTPATTKTGPVPRRALAPSFESVLGSSSLVGPDLSHEQRGGDVIPLHLSDGEASGKLGGHRHRGHPHPRHRHAKRSYDTNPSLMSYAGDDDDVDAASKGRRGSGGEVRLEGSGAKFRSSLHTGSPFRREAVKGADPTDVTSEDAHYSETVSEPGSESGSETVSRTATDRRRYSGQKQPEETLNVPGSNNCLLKKKKDDDALDAGINCEEESPPRNRPRPNGDVNRGTRREGYHNAHGDTPRSEAGVRNKDSDPGAEAVDTMSQSTVAYPVRVGVSVGETVNQSERDDNEYESRRWEIAEAEASDSGDPELWRSFEDLKDSEPSVKTQPAASDGIMSGSEAEGFGESRGPRRRRPLTVSEAVDDKADERKIGNSRTLDRSSIPEAAASRSTAVEWDSSPAEASGVAVSDPKSQGLESLDLKSMSRNSAAGTGARNQSPSPKPASGHGTIGVINSEVLKKSGRMDSPLKTEGTGEEDAKRQNIDAAHQFALDSSGPKSSVIPPSSSLSSTSLSTSSSRDQFLRHPSSSPPPNGAPSNRRPASMESDEGGLSTSISDGAGTTCESSDIDLDIDVAPCSVTTC